jgi:hypothetical protein
MSVTFDDARVGMVICHNHFPYKPFRIAEINIPGRRLVLREVGNKQRSCPFDADDFDAQGYVRNDEQQNPA